MASKIEIYNSFELNGKTYTGDFPVFVSEAICPVQEEDTFENEIEQQLKEISEN